MGVGHCSGEALNPGKHILLFDFATQGCAGVFTVDVKELARQTIPHTIPIIMPDAAREPQPTPAKRWRGASITFPSRRLDPSRSRKEPSVFNQ